MDLTSVQLPVPRTVLEAGGEPSARLLEAMGRCIAEMEPGDVLEVVSRSAGARMDAIAWCHVTGHELVALVNIGDLCRFWIRKHAGEERGGRNQG